MEINESLLKELSKKAINIRRNIIEMVYMASSGHPGGALSIADILTVLYFTEMEISPLNPKDENRDRFILSAGHGSALLYSLLHIFGYDLSLEDLKVISFKVCINREFVSRIRVLSARYKIYALAISEQP